ncbi:UDP-N-acetylmuramate--L-alanine ligase [Myceligenerans indicum]|uniref:UDP-N-acetylmuramate--L-alanine ligase n=1 Tax=Myceligenerans indicum TaxID=2593663 RepID=A0ABS1LMH8_9MICO|nr:UDP-N-acetylmuramate--L-alanine ligase [Myceligenerans indicum]MBL0886757.1 UDP-N-acetylmuramate--L-alanine ligase [Myceligenerans indicum]
MIGIGGAGMSVIAHLLHARGVPVQGSDGVDSATVTRLRDAGVPVWVGHDAAHVSGEDGDGDSPAGPDADGGGPVARTGPADTVVVSSAVRDGNPELAAARAAGLRVLHRSEALAALMAGGRGVAVAGAAGKTTTSAMLAVVLRETGADPSYAIGSTVRTAGTETPGGHLGSSDILVAEADESDGSFLNYEPVVSVVTNVEPDHLDHWGTTEAIHDAFVEFAGRLRPGGMLVACADDDGSLAVARQVTASGGRVVTYGESAGADVRVTDVTTTADGAGATLTGAPLGPEPLAMRLVVTGRHNVLNATAAVVAAVLLGVPARDAVAAARAFTGTGRRFELRGSAGGVRVVDDYAHHPTKVAALLEAARTVAAPGRVLVLFQPHLFSRTRDFAADFARVLSPADKVVVTGVYAAREDPDPQVGPRTITALMSPDTARAVDDMHDAAREVADLARPGDLVLTVGAGDVTLLGPEILDRLAARVAAGELADAGTARG